VEPKTLRSYKIAVPLARLVAYPAVYESERQPVND
jgi:hypothetical protein